MASDAMGVDAEVFLSIERKEKIVSERRKQIQQEISNKWYAEQEVVFEKFKNCIEKVEGESYKETETRLSNAIGEKIHGSTFHKIVKAIRK